MGLDSVVPLAVEVVALEIEGVHVGVGDFDALGIGVGVEFAADGQAGVSVGSGDQLDDGVDGLAAIMNSATAASDDHST